MTHYELDNMFDSARKAPVTSSVEEVTAWVTVAAASTAGVLGLSAKLKLFILKKSIIMIGSIVSVAGVVSVTLFMSGSPSEKPTHTASLQTVTTEQVLEQQSQETAPQETIIIRDSASKEEAPQLTNNVETPDVSAPTTPTVVVEAPVLPRRTERPAKRSIVVSYDPPKGTGVAPVSSSDKHETVKGSGHVTKEVRKVGAFSQINSSGIFDVYITQGNESKVVVEADDNLQKYIKVDMDGKELRLSSTEKVNIKSSTKMNIYITVKELDVLTYSGIGDVTFQGVLKSSSFHATIGGVGDVNMKLANKSTDIKYTGVGDIQMDGSSDFFELNSSGVGDIKGYTFESKRAEVKHSGVGDVMVYASEDLKLDFSGVGNTYYKGNPTTKNINKRGIGSVKAK